MRIRRAVPVALCLLALSACGVEVGPPGPFRDHFYTKLRTELVFDGKRITVEGTSRCTRSDVYNSHGKVVIFVNATGPLYRCGPKWFGKRLVDGGALLVGAYRVSHELFDARGVLYKPTTPSNRPGPDMARHRERVAKIPRAVIWLNDAKNPTRGEYYYSAIALEDPGSRLKEIKSEIVAVSTDYISVSDPADEVPWVGDGYGPRYLVARYANVVPIEYWSKVQEIEKILVRHNDSVVLLLGRGITQNQIRTLNSIGLNLIERPHSYMWPRPQAFVLQLGVGRTARSSKDYFKQSLHRKAVQRGSDDILRFVGSLPRGVLPLTGKDGTGLPVGAEISSRVLKPPRGKWLASYYYDPRTGDIYRFFGFRFNSGKDGHGYR